MSNLVGCFAINVFTPDEYFTRTTCNSALAEHIYKEEIYHYLNEDDVIIQLVCIGEGIIKEWFTRVSCKGQE